ncbi:Hsp20/alpha crystallin family protein [[Eubacterium] cellulosolvens]
MVYQNLPFGVLNTIEDSTPRPIRPRRPFPLPKPSPWKIRIPIYDFFEEKNAVRLYIEIPGVDHNDIVLNISQKYAEIRTDVFYTKLKLPRADFDLETVKANLKNGVLRINIPKRIPKLKKKRILVK